MPFSYNFQYEREVNFQRIMFTLSEYFLFVFFESKKKENPTKGNNNSYIFCSATHSYLNQLRTTSLFTIQYKFLFERK